MKSQKSNLFKSSLATTVFCGALINHFTATSASATDRYWDIDGNTAGFTTIAGAWNGTNAFWSTSSAGGPAGTLVASPTSADDIFVSAGATGTITLTGAQSASSITLSAAVSKTISGGTSITIGGTGANSGLFSTASTSTVSSPIILNASSTAITYRSTASGATFTIGRTTGSAGTGVTLTISAEANGGAVTLNNIIADGAGGGKVAVNYSGTVGGFVVSGNSTYTGGTNINSTGTSTLAVTTATGFGAGPLTINGGSIRATVNGSGTTLGNAVTLGGDFTAATVVTEKNLTFTGPVTLTGNRTITGNIGTTVNTQALIFSNVIGDGGSGFGLTQNGTGRLTLSGANTYSGPTNVSAGTLTLGNATSTILNTAPVTISGGILDVANSDTVGAITISSGTISGVGTLTGSSYDLQGGTVTAVLGGGVAVGKSTAGVANLGGTQVYTDATNVTGGTLNVTGTLANTLITVSNNAKLGGEGSSAGNVVFNAGSGFVFDPNTTAANQYFRTIGNINTTAGAGTKINIDLTGATTNTSVVVFEAGSITTNGLSDFKLNARGTLSLTATQLLFNSGAAASVVWKGANGTNPTFWDVGATDQNWTLLGVDNFFFFGDNVIFNNSAANFNPAVQSPLAAGTITFNNALVNPYTLSGASVTATSLTKTDTGKVTISNAITLSGGTTISNGTIQLGDGTNATGSVSGTISNNAAFITNFGVNNVTLNNDISGSGSLTQAGAGTVILTGTNSYGSTTIDSGATLQIGSGGAVGSLGTGAITNNGALVFNRDNSSSINVGSAIGGSGSLTKQGAGALTLSVANGFTGATTISTGALIVSADGALGSNAAGTTLALGRSLGLSGGIDYATTEFISGYGAGTTIVNVGPLAVANRGFIQSVSGNNTFRGNIELTLDGQSRIGTQDGAQLTLTGAITQASGVTTASILFRAGNTAGDFVTLSNAGNSFGDNSTIFTGATGTDYAGVRLGIKDALPTDLTISGFVGTGTATALDLFGYNQTLNGLIGSGSGSLRIINKNTGDPSILTLNPTTNLSSPTLILGGGGLEEISLVKDGLFTQTLSAANTYSGNTTVNGGTLSLGVANTNNETSTVTIAPTAFLDLTYSGTDTVEKLFIGATQLAAGTYGPTATPIPQITNSTGSGTLTVTSGPPVSGYASWINGFFPGVTDLAIIGVGADPDSDGIKNSVEMVIGGNPATGMDTALLPTIKLVTDPVGDPNTIPAGNYLLFTYRRSDLSVAGGVTADCETNTDLVAPWTAATGTPGVVIQVDNDFIFTPPAAAATDQVRVYVPRGANTKLFGRLNVLVP